MIYFVVFVRLLQDGEKYLLAPVNSSGSRNLLLDSGIDDVKGRVITPNVASRILQQRHTSQVTDV